MGLNVCTAVAANYLAQARVLAASVRERNPGARVWALVTDPGAALRVDEPFVPLAAADVGVDELELARRALAYPAQALVSSLKPAMLRACLRLAGGAPVLMLDSDILVTGSLEGVAARAEEVGLLLSPHSPFPLPHVPGGGSVEEGILRAGVFNGGFAGIAPAAEPFLEWWDERCARDSVWDPERGIVLSQSWLTLATALFGHGVLRDPGCNVMVHNLYGRDVSRSADGGWLIGSEPLRFFHFGNFDPRTPSSLTRSPPRASWQTLEEKPGVAGLVREYVARLRSAGLDDALETEVYGTTLPGGTPVGSTMRRAYLDGLIEAERSGDRAPEPPNPLVSGDTPAFLAWLRAPAPGTRAVPRYLMALRARRADLRAAYPEVPGEHEDQLLHWATLDLDAQDPEWALVRAPAA